MSIGAESSGRVILEICRLESGGYYCERAPNKLTREKEDADTFTSEEADIVKKERISPDRIAKKIELLPSLIGAESSGRVILEICRLESEGYYCERAPNKLTREKEDADTFTSEEADIVKKERIRPDRMARKITLLPRSGF